jgi:hypothetical protein
MTVRMELGEMFADCPLAWQSFVIHTQKCLGYRSTHSGLSNKEIQKGLEQFKAEFTDYSVDSSGTIDFPSEAHYNLFVLKYGEEHVER